MASCDEVSYTLFIYIYIYLYIGFCILRYSTRKRCCLSWLVEINGVGAVSIAQNFISSAVHTFLENNPGNNPKFPTLISKKLPATMARSFY